MSFRRDADAELAWRRWVRAHEAELIAIGIPREVWSDRMTWGRFVEHGRHTADPRDIRFTPDDLPPDRQHRFYRFLDALPDHRASVVWLDLRRLLDLGDPPA